MLPRWKTRNARLSKSQFDVLSHLAAGRPGRYMPLELPQERVAKQMVQGVHPWIKTKPDPVNEGGVLYCITDDGRSKLKIEKAAREG